MPEGIKFRQPNVADGAEIWRLVRDSGSLDLNSAYLYLLLCQHFADTCVVAEQDGRLLGFVSGYRPPGRPDTLFLWQVGVDASARGRGLGKALVRRFLRSGDHVRTLETTVSPSNAASQALFRSIAAEFGAELRVTTGFTQDQFPGGQHEDEELYSIGPLNLSALNKHCA